MDNELTRNKKAYFDYEILEKYDAGIILKGYEVKSIRQRKVNLRGSYVSFRNGEAWLMNVTIAPYQPKNEPEESGLRQLKLLLNKREIAKLIHQSEVPGMTVVPLRIFLKNHRIKIEIGLARGKKSFDKRETIKKREALREVARRFKKH